MINDITIKGAREHNLKNVSVTLPKNKMIVIVIALSNMNRLEFVNERSIPPIFTSGPIL